MLAGSRRRIAIVIFGEPQVYPPTINAANILAENGYEIDIYAIQYKNIPDAIEMSKLIAVHYLSSHISGYLKIIQYPIVFLKLLIRVWSNKYNCIICYDASPVGIVYLISKLTGIKWIYHQHDFVEMTKGLWNRIIYFVEYKYGSRANLVTFPQTYRAKLFQERSNMKEMPLVVNNAPRRAWIKSTTIISPRLKEIKKEFEMVILYQGGLSRFFGFEKFLLSLSYMKSNVAVIFLGKELEPGIINYLKTIATDLNILSRVVFWDEYVPYDDLPCITGFCNLGLIKMAGEKSGAPINDKYLVGASNKIAEYMAASLPIICLDTEENRNFFEPIGNAIFFDSDNPVLFANFLDNLVANPNYLQQLKINSKFYFDNYLNFDLQFKKILDFVNG